MKIGDIILIPFPFTDLTTSKARPVVVATITKDRYKDLVIAAISSVVPIHLTGNEMLISPSLYNKLKVNSVLKIDRLATVKQVDMIAPLGQLDSSELKLFQSIFKKLVD
jgi:mRNA interferase MazF